MDTKFELTANYASLKKCKKTYGVLFYYYIASSLLLLLYSFTNLVCLGVDANIIMKAGAEPLAPSYMLLLIDAIIIAPLTLFLSTRICLKQHDLSAILMIIFLILNLSYFIYKRNSAFFDRVPIAFWTFMLYNIFGISGGCIGFKTNLKYHWLEEQYGFPLFNERAEEQKVRIDQFQCEYNRLKRTQSNAMDELTFPDLTNKTK